MLLPPSWIRSIPLQLLTNTYMHTLSLYNHNMMQINAIDTSYCDFSHKLWVLVLKSKKEVIEKFVQFKALEKTQSNYKTKAFWSDNSGEFLPKKFKQFFKFHDMDRQLSMPHTAIECSGRARQHHHCGDGEEHNISSKP